MEPNVRKARPGDADTLVAFNLCMAWETENRRLDPEVLRRGVHAVFDSPSRGFYLVAELEGQVAGCLLVTTEWSDWRNSEFWWVQSVYVKPDCRRRGVFRALLQHVRDLAQASTGVCGFRLYVEKDNSAAQATYAKLGFAKTPYRMFECL